MRLTSRARALVIGAVCLVLTPALLVACTSDRDTTSIGSGGGTVVSPDKSVTVRFSTGEADDGTEVKVVTAIVDAPPPPPMVEPIDRPFDVVVSKGAAHRGTVTVAFGRLPEPSNGEPVYLFIEGGPAGWELLPTTVDPAAGTVTAVFPHFSRGFLGRLRGVAGSAVGSIGDGLDATWNWGSDQVKRGGRTVSELAAGAAKTVASGMFTVAGGKLEAVTCNTPSKDWEFKGLNGNGGSMIVPPLTGCSEPYDPARSSWQVRIGNRYPAPYLLSVPAGAHPPGFFDLPESTDLADMLITMVLSRWDRTVVPGGGATSVRITPSAGTSVRLGGYTDPWTLAVRAAAVIATIATKGESAASVRTARTELEAEFKAWDDALAAARKAGDDRLTNAEYAQATGWDSALARKKRALDRTSTAVTIDQMFNNIDLINCGVGLIRDIGGAGSLREKAGQAFDEIGEKCFPTWARRSATNGVSLVAGSLDPTAQQKAAAEMAKGILSDILEIRDLAFAADTFVLKEFSQGRFDYVHAQLQADRLVDAPAPGAAVTPIQDQQLMSRLRTTCAAGRLTGVDAYAINAAWSFRMNEAEDSARGTTVANLQQLSPAPADKVTVDQLVNDELRVQRARADFAAAAAPVFHTSDPVYDRQFGDQYVASFNLWTGDPHVATTYAELAASYISLGRDFLAVGLADCATPLVVVLEGPGSAYASAATETLRITAACSKVYIGSGGQPLPLGYDVQKEDVKQGRMPYPAAANVHPAGPNDVVTWASFTKWGFPDSIHC